MAGQVFLHLLVMVLIVLTLLAIRVNWHNQYEDASFRAINASVKLFQIGENNDGEKQLLYRGQAYDAQQFSNANELGVTGNTAFLGYLASVEQVINRYNANTKVQAHGVIASINRSNSQLAANKQYAIVPSYFLFAEQEKEESRKDEYRFIYFDFPYDKQDIPANKVGIQLLQQAINAGRCLEHGEVIERWPNQINDSKHNATLSSLKKVSNKVAMTPCKDKTVISKVSLNITSKLNHASAELDKLFQTNTCNCSPQTHENITQIQRSSLCTQGHDSSEFHCQLAILWQQEMSFFWLYGNWKWIDIILITMFGVMVESMTRLGLFVVGRQPERIAFQPGEFYRTLMKLTYAPVTSVVVIWTLLATNILTSEVAGITGQTAIITLALIFGLFPNITYGLLQKIGNMILRNTSVNQRQNIIEPKINKVVLPANKKGELPHVASLKTRVKKVVTTMLKEQ